MGKIGNPVTFYKQSIVEAWQDFTPSKKNEKSKQSVRNRDLWQSTTKALINDFNESTTFHGVKYAFGPKIALKRRVIWIILCLTSACLVSVDVVERIQHYLSYPTSLNLQMHYVDSMEFPAVTICNQNSFRRTLAMEHGQYDILKALYENPGDSLTSRKRNSLLKRWGNKTMEQFYVYNSHKAEDLIVTCNWKGQPCQSSDFKTILTKHGQCYTFQGNTVANDSLYVDSPGVDNGLELVLNAEDYDSMVGPHSSSGVKIVLHQKNEVPLPEYGNVLPAGRHGFVDVQVSKETNVPQPHGKCVSQPLMYMNMYSYTVGACHMECEMEYVTETCKCREIHMPKGINSFPPCSIHQYRKCVQEAKDKYRRRGQGRCLCPIPCAQTWYLPTLSYGSISRFSSSQMRVLTDSALKVRLENAREMAFPEEMGHVNLNLLFGNLIKKSVPKFFQVLKDLERIDDILSMSSTEIKGFKTGVGKAVKYLTKAHNVYSEFFYFTALLDKLSFGDNIKGLTSYLDGQLRIMVTTNNTEQRTAYYGMMKTRVAMETKAADSILKKTDFLLWLQKQYPNIWFTDNGDLQTVSKPSLYKVPADVSSNGILTTIRKTKDHLKLYVRKASEFMNTGTINFTEITNLNATIMMCAERFESERASLDAFYNESVESNLKHLGYVLKERSVPMADVIATFDKKCKTMYITKAIRSASMYLNMSVSFLTKYFEKKVSLKEIILGHFDSDSMKYFMEEVRTFASGTFNNKELSMESVDCLEMLLDAYHAMLTFYQAAENALENYKYKYDYNKDTTILKPSATIEEMRSVMFDKTDLLEVVLVLDKIIMIMKEYKDSLKVDQQFYRDNFLHLNVMFHDLRYEEILQQIDYTVFALMGDIGGAMGLCIGASVLSVFEIIDFTIVLVGSMASEKKSRKSPNVIKVKPKEDGGNRKETLATVTNYME